MIELMFAVEADEARWADGALARNASEIMHAVKHDRISRVRCQALLTPRSMKQLVVQNHLQRRKGFSVDKRRQEALFV